MSDASLTSRIATARALEDGSAAADLDATHRTHVGMVCFLCSEAAFFGTLIVAYLTYLGDTKTGPTPAEVLSLPLVIAGTAALVASSVTVHLAHAALRAGRASTFRTWLAATIVLGALFLVGTAVEWHELIFEHGLTISRNLFGTTYFTLVGFHGLHVTVGLLLLTLMYCLSLPGFVSQRHSDGFDVISWYWHFVDSVWIVVFAVVYVFGR
jgi:cytochrome c oxidase subunit III